MRRNRSVTLMAAVVLAFTFVAAALSARADESDLSFVDAISKRVVAGERRWVRVVVAVPVPSDVTFEIYPRISNPDGSATFSATVPITDEFFFEWRGRSADGDPVFPGTYDLEINATPLGAPSDSPGVLEPVPVQVVPSPASEVSPSPAEPASPSPEASPSAEPSPSPEAVASPESPSAPDVSSPSPEATPSATPSIEVSPSMEVSPSPAASPSSDASPPAAAVAIASPSPVPAVAPLPPVPAPDASIEIEVVAAETDVETAPPPAPTGLVVYGGDSDRLSWDPSPAGDWAYYRVYSSTAKEGPWALVDSTTFTDLDAPHEGDGSTWYRVTAVDTSDTESEPSAAVLNSLVRVSATVGPAGGTLEAPNGSVRLEIPAGALGSEVTITIEQQAEPPFPGSNREYVGGAFDITPSRLAFEVPAKLTVELTIPKDSALLENYPGDTISLASTDPSSPEWGGVAGSHVDASAGEVSAPITELALYAPLGALGPHGTSNLTGGDSVCVYCHQGGSHAGEGLHEYATQKETCYQCHNNGEPGYSKGASTDILADFGETTIGATTKTSYHPVPLPLPGETVTLQCDDCHTPHRQVTDYTKLLRVVDGSGDFQYSTVSSPIGNGFCYRCHGANSEYPAPFGDFSGFEGTAHDTGALNPPDGYTGASSQIRCLSCHEAHASSNTYLTKADGGENLCYECHTGTANSSGGPADVAKSDPYAAFSTPNDYDGTDGVRIFHHPVSNADQAVGARQVECASCHNSHIADATDTATTGKLANPANTNDRFIVTWTPGSFGQRGDINDFCTTCHVSPSDTQPLTGTGDGRIPYTVKLENDTGGNADGSDPAHAHDLFTLADWTANAVHGPTGGDLACTACHDIHGSSNAFALKEGVVAPDDRGGIPAETVTTVTGWQDDQSVSSDVDTIRSFCTACHGAEVAARHPVGSVAYDTECTACHFHTAGGGGF